MTATVQTQEAAAKALNARKSPKEVLLSEKSQKWCRKVAGVAAKRAFRVKNWDYLVKDFGADKLSFYFLPKIYQRHGVSRTDRKSKIFLHPDYFDEKGNLKKKMPKELKDELKAAIFKEVAHFAVKRVNTDFYKIMIRCPWAGARVDGALKSPTPAREQLEAKKEAKAANRRKVVEVPTGIKEKVEILDLKSKQKVLVEADIYLANGSTKIARALYEGRKLRKMLPGGKALKAKLGLK